MKKRFVFYGLVILILVGVLIGKNNNSNYKNYYNSALISLKSIWQKQNTKTNVKIQYDYGFINNNKVLNALNNLKSSNPEQIEKFKRDIKTSILKITENLGIDTVDFIESGKTNHIVILHEQIDTLHSVLNEIREHGIIIKQIQIFKPTDKYNLDIKVEL